MVWIILAITFMCVVMFFGTVSMQVKTQEDEALWVKVKLKVNNDIQASWCKVSPGKGVEFYTLDGEEIDQKENRVSLIEPCLESSTNNPIPEK